MRILHLSDLHVGGERLEEQRRILTEITDGARAAGVHLTLLTGDLYGKTVPHRSTPEERAVLFPAVVALAELGPVVVVVGNHDVAEDLEGLVHLSGLWPIRVVAGAEVFDVDTEAGRARVYALAYPTKRWLLAGLQAPGLVEAQRMVQERLGTLCKVWGERVTASRAAGERVVHLFAGHLQILGCRTAGGEVLAGQEIELTAVELETIGADYAALGHLHLQQEVAWRSWYAGSPWRTDFGEREDAKGALIVGVHDLAPQIAKVIRVYRSTVTDPAADVTVQSLITSCRKLITLEYRWAIPEGRTEPTWTAHPQLVSDGGDKWVARLGGLDVRGAEVKARLTVPAQLVQTCPWDEELERIRSLGAARVVVERVIEPVLRMRAPEIVHATNNAQRLTAYWTTLATMPTTAECQATLAALDDLEGMDDAALTDADNAAFR